ncbi:MAG: hypothetical protein VXX02_11550, partial [Pseudomonadota bacterium]|nr:hypothetical protein [Pseudomonadota bacterium]
MLFLRSHSLNAIGTSIAFSIAAIAPVMAAQAETAQADEDVIEEVVVTGDLNSLPGENVESIFGFNKSILETPRSVSTVSE